MPKLQHLGLVDHQGNIFTDMMEKKLNLNQITSVELSQKQGTLVDVLGLFPSLRDLNLGSDAVGKCVWDNIIQYVPCLEHFKCANCINYEDIMRMQAAYYGNGQTIWTKEFGNNQFWFIFDWYKTSQKTYSPPPAIPITI